MVPVGGFGPLRGSCPTARPAPVWVDPPSPWLDLPSPCADAFPSRFPCPTMQFHRGGGRPLHDGGGCSSRQRAGAAPDPVAVLPSGGALPWGSGPWVLARRRPAFYTTAVVDGDPSAVCRYSTRHRDGVGAPGPTAVLPSGGALPWWARAQGAGMAAAAANPRPLLARPQRCRCSRAAEPCTTIYWSFPASDGVELDRILGDSVLAVSVRASHLAGESGSGSAWCGGDRHLLPGHGCMPIRAYRRCGRVRVRLRAVWRHLARDGSLSARASHHHGRVRMWLRVVWRRPTTPTAQARTLVGARLPFIAGESGNGSARSGGSRQPPSFFV
jgi:hypothetical protein